MNKVLITGSNLRFKDEEKKLLEDIAKVTIDDTWKKKEILRIIPEIDGLMVDIGVSIDKDIFEKARKLRIIVEYGTGVNNIDIKEASKRGIYVCNLPDVYKNEVAEFTVGLIFCLCKEIVKENNDLKEQKIWDQNRYTPKLILNKKIGLIGFGLIARRVKELLENFNLEFLIYDPFLNKKFIQKEYGVKVVDIENLLGQSDIISIHIPLTKENRNFIDFEKIKLMKKDAVLINVSRGGIVNEKDLYVALKNEIINGAAFDVFENEPIDKDNVLLGLDNLIVTPHIAWKSEESERRCEMMAATKIRDFLLGKEITGVVNLKDL